MMYAVMFTGLGVIVYLFTVYMILDFILAKKANDQIFEIESKKLMLQELELENQNDSKELDFLNNDSFKSFKKEVEDQDDDEEDYDFDDDQDDENEDGEDENEK